MNYLSKSIVILLLPLALYSNISFAEGWVSVPSVAFTNETVTLVGGGFTSNEVVTLIINSPDANSFEQVINTDSNGNLEINFLVEMGGEYRAYAYPSNSPNDATFEAVMQVTDN